MDHLKEAKQLLNTWAEHANVEDAKVHALIAIAESQDAQLVQNNAIVSLLEDLVTVIKTHCEIEGD